MSIVDTQEDTSGEKDEIQSQLEGVNSLDVQSKQLEEDSIPSAEPKNILMLDWCKERNIDEKVVEQLIALGYDTPELLLDLDEDKIVQLCDKLTLGTELSKENLVKIITEYQQKCVLNEKNMLLSMFQDYNEDDSLAIEELSKFCLSDDEIKESDKFWERLDHAYDLITLDSNSSKMMKSFINMAQPNLEFTMLIVGRTGTGKSTLCNIILGDNQSPTSDIKSQSTALCEYHQTVNFFDKKIVVTVLDTRGISEFGDMDSTAEEQLIDDIDKYLMTSQKLINLILLCSPIDEPRFDKSIMTIIQLFHKIYDIQWMQTTAIVLTKCNKEKPQQVKARLDEWKNQLDNFLKKYLGQDYNPSLFPMLLAASEKHKDIWFPKFFCDCMKKVCAGEKSLMLAFQYDWINRVIRSPNIDPEQKKKIKKQAILSLKADMKILSRTEEQPEEEQPEQKRKSIQPKNQKLQEPKSQEECQTEQQKSPKKTQSESKQEVRLQEKHQIPQPESPKQIMQVSKQQENEQQSYQTQRKSQSEIEQTRRPLSGTNQPKKTNSNGVCFGINSFVYRVHENNEIYPISVENIQIGDVVLSADKNGKLCRSSIWMIPHQIEEDGKDEICELINIWYKTDENIINMLDCSKDHLIYIYDSKKLNQIGLTPAIELKIGDQIFVFNKDNFNFNLCTILNIESKQNKVRGIHTSTGNIIVNNVLCSCYVGYNMKHHQLLHQLSISLQCINYFWNGIFQIKGCTMLRRKFGKNLSEIINKIC